MERQTVIGRNDRYALEDVSKVIVRLLDPSRILLYSQFGVVGKRRRFVRDGDIFLIVLSTLPTGRTQIDCMTEIGLALPSWEMDVDILVLTEEIMVRAIVESDPLIRSALKRGILLYDATPARAVLAG